MSTETTYGGPELNKQENKALLIIDMQAGNFSGEDPIYNGNGLLDKIKKLIDRARAAGLTVVYVQNTGGSGDPDEYGSAGWEIHPSIQPSKGDVVVQKRSPDSFHETGLHDELAKHQVGHLYVAGLQTEYCVDTTCRRAFTLGYKVTLVEDAHSTWNSPLLSAQQIIDHHNQVLGGWFTELKKEWEVEF
jgi:nicotinamidase-related amidase